MQTLKSSLMQPEKALFHLFTTRIGGESIAPYDSNNLAFHVGDDKKSVLANHQKLADACGYERSQLVHMRQIHSNRVTVVDESHDFEHPPECDAVVTDREGVPLMVMVADCTPILLFDPKKRVIAAIHAGRAGAFNNITAATLEVMQESFGCDTADILAVLGPSIHVCCYEVGKAIADEAQAQGVGYAIEAREGSHYLDVNKIIKKQLAQCGVTEAHTEEMPLCSACENRRFFSYRADKQQTGRMAGVIMLTPV